MTTQRFLKFIPSDKSNWLIKRSNFAFILLCIIASRARRTSNNTDGLEIGEAYLGDWESYGMTRQNYRTALKVLISSNFIKISETNRTRKKSTTGTTTEGTKVKLLNSEVWDINSEIDNHQPNHCLTTDQPLPNHEQEGIRKNKNIKKEKVKKEKILFSSDSIEYGLSSFLFESLIKIIPDFIKPDLQKWSYEFDKMIRLDNRSPEKIKENILSITIGTSWWVGKVFSPDGLRTNWYKISSNVSDKLQKKPSEHHKEYSKQVLNEYKSPNCDIYLQENDIAFCTIGQGEPKCLKYSEVDFMKKIETLLKYNGFKKLVSK